jgi:hypothetical protein
MDGYPFLSGANCNIFVFKNQLFFNDPDAAPAPPFDRQGLVAFGTFDINQIIKKPDAVVMGEEVELGAALGAGGDISSCRGGNLLLHFPQCSPELFHVLLKLLEAIF